MAAGDRTRHLASVSSVSAPVSCTALSIRLFSTSWRLKVEWLMALRTWAVGGFSSISLFQVSLQLLDQLIRTGRRNLRLHEHIHFLDHNENLTNRGRTEGTLR